MNYIYTHQSSAGEQVWSLDTQQTGRGGQGGAELQSAGIIRSYWAEPFGGRRFASCLVLRHDGGRCRLDEPFLNGWELGNMDAQPPLDAVEVDPGNELF